MESGGQAGQVPGWGGHRPFLLGSWRCFAVIYTGVGRVERGLRIGVQSPQGRGGSWGAGRGQSELSPELVTLISLFIVKY